jgi:hypothetical protein
MKRRRERARESVRESVRETDACKILQQKIPVWLFYILVLL